MYSWELPGALPARCLGPRPGVALRSAPATPGRHPPLPASGVALRSTPATPGTPGTGLVLAGPGVALRSEYSRYSRSHPPGQAPGVRLWSTPATPAVT
jgi:hypothetical protein